MSIIPHSYQESTMPHTTTETQKLKYALSKQVPDMLRGFTIHTNYGDIEIEPEFAEAFRNLAADVLQYQLNIASIDE
nr:hypothetical protein [uncultured Desulfobulbus sp.]